MCRSWGCQRKTCQELWLKHVQLYWECARMLVHLLHLKMKAWRESLPCLFHEKALEVFRVSAALWNGLCVIWRHVLNVPSYSQRLAVLSWLSSPSAASWCLAACPSLLPVNVSLLDLEINRLPLKAAASSTRVSLPAGLSGSRPEELFCCRRHFYIPTAFFCIHLILNYGFICSPGYSPGNGLMNPHPFDALWFQEFMFPANNSDVVLCHHRMLLHPESFALVKHCGCSKSGGSWDRGNLVFFPQPLQGYSSLLRRWGSLSDLFRKLSGKFSNSSLHRDRGVLLVALAYNNVQSVFLGSTSVWQIKDLPQSVNLEGHVQAGGEGRVYPTLTENPMILPAFWE